MEFGKAYFDAGLERRGTDCVKWDAMSSDAVSSAAASAVVSSTAAEVCACCAA